MPSRKEEIGRRLREARLARDLIQEDVARRFPGKLTSAQLSNYENGKNTPEGGPRLEQIAAILGVDTKQLLADLPPDSGFSQLDRLERKVELLLDALQVDWRPEFAREITPFEVVAGLEETAPLAAPPAEGKPARDRSRRARGQN